MSTATTTIVLQITPFHNCEGCTKKLVKELRKIGGARLLSVDSINDKFTISTLEHPEVIRAALQQKFPNKSVILLVNHQGGIGIQEMALAMMRLPQAGRIRNVEWTQDGLRINFYEIQPFVENVHGSHSAHVEDVPPEYVPPSPSAPPIPTIQGSFMAILSGCMDTL